MGEPPIEFLDADGADAADEELPQPPARSGRWVRIGLVAGCAVVVAGFVVHGVDHSANSPAPAGGPTATTSPILGGGVLTVEPPDVYPVPLGSPPVRILPVGCNQPARVCMLDPKVPRTFLTAVSRRFPHVGTSSAITTRSAHPAHGHLVQYDFTAHAGGRTISISVRPAQTRKPSHVHVRRSGGRGDIRAVCSRGGYRISVDVRAPLDRLPSATTVAQLARDPRLRP